MSCELKPQRISVKPDGSQGHRKQMLRNSKVLKNSKEHSDVKNKGKQIKTKKKQWMGDRSSQLSKCTIKSWWTKYGYTSVKYKQIYE